MKKIILILIVLMSVNVYAQKPIVDWVDFEEYTTAEIDLLVPNVPFTRLIYDTDKERFVTYNGTSWESLLKPLDLQDYATQMWVQNQGYAVKDTLTNKFIPIWNGTKLVDSDIRIDEGVSGKSAKINAGFLSLFWDSSKDLQGDPGLFLYKDATWIGGVTYNNDVATDDITIWHNQGGKIKLGSNIEPEAFVLNTNISNGGAVLKGNFSASKFTSTIPTGTAPLTVASTTKVANLNADLLDGLDSTDLVTKAGTETMTGVKSFSTYIDLSTATNGFVLGNKTNSNKIFYATTEKAFIFIESDNTFAGVRASDLYLPPVNFASLPSGAQLSVGLICTINDASSITYRGTASGGGSDFALVIYDGTNWIYH